MIAPGFYSGAETHLTEIFKRIEEHIRRGEITIVVSDMLQSAEDFKQMDLIRELSKLLADRRPEMLLLAFRSGFNGPYYVSMSAGGSYPLRLQEGPGQGRPFYLLVFAPDQASLEMLRKYALTGVGEEASFQPTLPLAIDKDKPEFMAAQTSPLFWSRYQAPELVVTERLSPASLERLAESASSGAGGSGIEFKFTGKPRVPVINPARSTLRSKKPSSSRESRL